MLSALSGIWDAIKHVLFVMVHFGAYIKYGAILVVNAWIAGLADILQGLINAAPSMPSPPSEPSWFSNTAGWVAWVWPVDTSVLIMAAIVTWSIAWFVLSIFLRWAKAVE